MAERRYIDDETINCLKLSKSMCERLFDIQYKNNVKPYVVFKSYIAKCVLGRLKNKYKNVNNNNNNDDEKWILENGHSIFYLDDDEPIFDVMYLNPYMGDDDLPWQLPFLFENLRANNNFNMDQIRDERNQFMETFLDNIYVCYNETLRDFGSEDEFFDILKKCSKLKDPLIKKRRKTKKNLSNK